MNTAGVALLVALSPLTPPIYVWSQISHRRQRRRLETFRPVRSHRRDGAVFTLVLDDGSEVRVDPDAVVSAGLYTWGDGINGSRVECGLDLDGVLRVRFDAWHVPLDPLLEALRARGSLSQPRNEHTPPHPDEQSGFLAAFAILGAAIDVLVLGVLGAWLWSR